MRPAAGLGIPSDFAVLADPVAIGDVQGANPRTGQIDRHGRAQATGPDDQNACLQQARLSLKPDLVEQQMARIAHQRRIIQE